MAELRWSRMRSGSEVLHCSLSVPDGHMNKSSVWTMEIQMVYRYLCQVYLSVQVLWALDEVKILNPPDRPLSDHPLEVLYSCDGPATGQLDCVVSFETGTVSTVLLRRWSCVPGGPHIRTVKLHLPDWLVYRADGIVPDSQWVLSCILRASVGYGGSDETQRRITAQDVAALQPQPFFSRPVKQHRLCSAWSSQMLQFTQPVQNKQCPVEQETVFFLSSIFASTGENFGVTKTLDPHRSEVLEHHRLRAVSSPWCMFSVWMFVTRFCQDTLCGVLHHIDSHHSYVTPALFLTHSGKVHIQLNGRSEESSAFLSSFKVPVAEWCQLSVKLQGRAVTVSMLCVAEEQRTLHHKEYLLGHGAVLDDTDGYFVIGGGKYTRGVEGYFGPVVYYRNRIPTDSPSEVLVPDVIRSVDLSRWLQTCEEFRVEMSVKIRGYSLRAREETESETCFDVFREWLEKDRLPSRSQCELWEEVAPHRRHAAQLVRFLSFKHGGRRAVSPAAVGRALYSLSLQRLRGTSSTGVVSRILPVLLQAGCLADTRALNAASVLYSSGLGVQAQPMKAWLLVLLAAHRDDRLALLHLGHLHLRGLLGLPADPDLAYAYNANIARQTSVDRHSPSARQAFVEAVYLNDDEALTQQTNTDHHIFQWLQLQARRGAAEAEQSVARMLFWGQQGVSPNIQEAVKHYERGAVRWEDPALMYNYGIVLLQGHGVEQDVPKALTFLKKAKDQGFVPAINALAWYYEQLEQDYERAVRLWEEADLLRDPEAPLNLGVMYFRGLYPGKAASQYMAYKYYQKSAERGHIRGGVLLADILNTGIPGVVTRRPAEAVLWVKWAAEHNGYLGSVLRRALDSYLNNDLFTSLFHYTVAAESGFAAAQFNAAYLCEQNPGGFLDPTQASRCMRRYYNLTIQSQDPDTYAFIRMGDLLYDERGDGQNRLLSAAQMYTRAALKDDPQGWYSLGLLVEQGYRLPLSVLIELGLSDLYRADCNLLLSALYRRCRDSEDSDSYLPCSLALLSVYLQSFQQDYCAAVKWSTTVAVIAAPTVLFMVLGVFRRRVVVS